MTGPYLNDSFPPLTHQPEIQKYSYAIGPKGLLKSTEMLVINKLEKQCLL